MANPNRLPRRAARARRRSSTPTSRAGRCALRPPALLRIDDGDIDARHRHVDLHMKALAGHPVDALAGFTAPPEWIVVGVVAEECGRAITLLSRAGVEVSAVRRRGRPLEFVDDRVQGRLVDTLRRVLDLPTEPPDVAMAELLAVYWLDAIVAAGEGAREPDGSAGRKRRACTRSPRCTPARSHSARTSSRRWPLAGPLAWTGTGSVSWWPMPAAPPRRGWTQACSPGGCWAAARRWRFS